MNLEFRNNVEWVVKVASFCMLGGYILGLGVVNLHLARFGITDFANLQPRYVLVGIISLLYPVATWVILVQVSLDVAGTLSYFRTFERATWSRLPILCVKIIFFIVPLSLAFIALDQLAVNQERRVGVALGAYGWSVGALVATFALVWLYKFFGKFADFSQNEGEIASVKRATQANRIIVTIFLGLASLYCFSNYLRIYSTDVFPLVRQQFGGGAPVEVTVHLRESNGSANAIEASMWFESSNSVLLETKDGKMFLLNKSAVYSIELKP